MAIPVFPLVGSTITPFSFNNPFFSASSIIPKAALSFILPPGLNFSSLTNTLFPSNKLFAFNIGVFPIKLKRLLKTI